jgi:hypothetical protein
LQFAVEWVVLGGGEGERVFGEGAGVVDLCGFRETLRGLDALRVAFNSKELFF